MVGLRDVSIAILSSLGTLLVSSAYRSHADHLTTLGRPKAVGEKAFVLAVNLQFQDNVSAENLLKAWGQAAEWCVKNEPFLYAYEVAQSDQDPLKYLVYERYRSKADYLETHKSSPAFKEFRPKMQALQESGQVVVSGHSFDEVGVGFI